MAISWVKSQMPDIAKHLDVHVAAFRNRPLSAGSYTYVSVDAFTHRCVRVGAPLTCTRWLPWRHASGQREEAPAG